MSITDALGYAEIKNNIKDPNIHQSLLTQLKSTTGSASLPETYEKLDQLLTNTTIKRACCLKKGNSSFNLRDGKIPIDVRIPAPIGHDFNNTLNRKAKEYNFIEKQVLIPPSICPQGYTAGTADCDNFYDLYCQVIAENFLKQNDGKWEQTNFGEYKPECGCYIPRHVAEKQFDGLKQINPRCWLPSCSGTPNIYKNKEAREECKASICQNNVDFSGVNAGGDIAAKINTNCPGAIKPKPPPPAPIDCKGMFQTCGANCKKKYIHTTIAQHGGAACPHENNKEVDCEPGQGNCPLPVVKKNCIGSFSQCATNCKKTWNITQPASGGGTCEYSQGTQLDCNPGEGQCPAQTPGSPAPTPAPDTPAPTPTTDTPASTPTTDTPAPTPTTDTPAPTPTPATTTAAQPSSAAQPAPAPAPSDDDDDSDNTSFNAIILAIIVFVILASCYFCCAPSSAPENKVV